MKKQHKPLKPFKGAIWNESKNRWEGTPSLTKKQKSLQDKIKKLVGKPSKPYKGKLTWVPIVKQKKKIRPIAKRKISDQTLYRKLKKEWNKTHRLCKPCLDGGKHTLALPYPHHMRGRGILLNDVRWWLPVCHFCHIKIEMDRAWARKMGYLLTRDAKAMKVEERKHELQ